ncbi:MAG: restriction endonuclease subunit S [Methanobacteriaceae archaeon]|jgi:type I restriction enzyme S subunit|nr:restriction endonuclease subunit S [Methanobacteriaceae archaeon]
MIPNKCGICIATKLPNSNKIKKFNKNDVLVSNIRPYFKKIWLADFDGGCSNDVLVFRAKKNIIPKFLYYALSSDEFFNYATLTSKGTRMPRGDKKAIMKYHIPNFSSKDQKKISSILSFLDGKIEVNKKINHSLIYCFLWFSCLTYSSVAN